MIFNSNINNMSGGVSQQSEEARYSNQVEEMVNFVPTVAQGLRRRNPINQLATLTTTFQDNMAIHSYERGDGVEKYGMIFDSNGLQVFDAVTGTEKTVTDIGSTSILTTWAGTDWENDLKFLTVGDTTWILNKSVTVATDGQLTPVIGNQNKAFYWIKRSYDDGSNHGYAYQIVLDDVKFNAVYPDATQYTAWGATSEEQEANWGFVYNVDNEGLTFADSLLAATALARYIDVYATKDYTARAEGSTVYVSCATSFTFESGDSYGNQASVGWTDSVSKIADLPAEMDGFTDEEIGTIAITGTDKDSFNNYYLKWDTDHWTETVQEGLEYRLDEKTMPAKLVRQADGSFVLGWNVENLSYDGFVNVWEDRDKGDEDSNPLPTFIGSKINNMFFFKNRLGFTSEENVILSATSDYYNFFATTVMEVLDSDPIDAAADSNNISIIKSVNVTAGAVTLWTDTAQFMLSGGDVLSPATTRISQTSTYVAHLDVEPISIDNEIMFFNKKGSWLETLIYAPASVNNDKSTAMSLSSHIPEYIPSTIHNVATSPNENMVFFFDKNEADAIYVYKYFIEDNKRVMSAWFKWTFSIQIRKIREMDNKLYILSGTNLLYVMDLPTLTVADTYKDFGTTSYLSSVTMSRFGVPTKQDTQNIREFFYMKTVKTIVDGSVDLDIINSERNNTKTIKTKHVNLGRRILIGSHSDNVKLKFKTSYDTGVSINALNIEGQMKYRSRNV